MKLIAPADVSVCALPEASNKPPFKFNAPEPKAAALPKYKRPPFTVVAPVVVFAPESVNEPDDNTVPPV